MRCSDCHSTLTFSGPGTNGRGRGYYCCNRYRKGSCSTSNHLSVIKLEKFILERIDADIGYFEDIPSQLIIDTETIELDTLQVQLGKTMRKYDIARKAYLNEIDTLEEYKASKSRIAQEEKGVRAQIKNLSNKATGLPDASIEQKNNALRSFVKGITIDKKNGMIDIEYYLNV